MNVVVSSTSTRARNASAFAASGSPISGRKVGRSVGVALRPPAERRDRRADVERGHHAHLCPGLGLAADAQVDAEVRGDGERPDHELRERDGEHFQGVLEVTGSLGGQLERDRAAEPEIGVDPLELVVLVEGRGEVGSRPGDGEVAVGDDLRATGTVTENLLVDRHVHAVSEPTGGQRQVDERGGRLGVHGGGGGRSECYQGKKGQQRPPGAESDRHPSDNEHGVLANR